MIASITVVTIQECAVDPGPPPPLAHLGVRRKGASILNPLLAESFRHCIPVGIHHKPLHDYFTLAEYRNQMRLSFFTIEEIFR